MPLSRLENFLKNAEGNILYVNPSDLSNNKTHKKIKRCIKCLESDNFPFIKFDDKGVCNYCNGDS